ncbi:MAG: transposase [Bacteroidetes bacterium]|nr:transposase [Bacteroidota bacterium]
MCTGRAKGGREIERSQYAEAVELNNRNYKRNQKLYRTRQEINEHIFGTIKRKWGYNYTNLIGLEKVNGEWSLIMLSYNIKRSFNILEFDDLMQTLKNGNQNTEKLGDFDQILLLMLPLHCLLFMNWKLQPDFFMSVYRV